MSKIKILFMFSLINFVGCNSSILDDPSTTIKYSIPESGHVSLTVENSYNTIIATLVDENQSAGTHEVTFDTSNLAEGIYFYTILFNGESGSYYKAQKYLIMLK
jgi:hypothetical protein